MSLIDVTFLEGVQINANVDGFDILTDQPENNGGTNAAPNPYYMFLVGLATCTGFFAQRFCRERDIATEGLGLTLDMERDEATHTTTKISMKLKLPESFPAKYQKAILRAAEQCAVKKTLENPPEIELLAV